jgi:Zn finger protein HypA/HybF involved in hydrogenase expression
MNRRVVVCPHCDLHFATAREKTYCPGCHRVVEPVAAR